MKLFVGNLSSNTTEGEIRELFEPYEPVAEIIRPLNRETGKPRAFAFVSVVDQAKAEQAIEDLDESKFGGRSLKVNEAEDRGGHQPESFNPVKENEKRVDDRPKDKSGKKVVYKSI